MRASPLVVACALVACTSREGAVFVPRRACDAGRFVIEPAAGPRPVWGGGSAGSSPAMITLTLDGITRAYALDLAGLGTRPPSQPVSRNQSVFARAQPFAAPGGAPFLAFSSTYPNRRWDVYLRNFAFGEPPIEDGFGWRRMSLSEDATENRDALAAADSTHLAVAYRADDRLAFVVTTDLVQLRRSYVTVAGGAGTAPLEPRRLLVTGAGFAALVSRGATHTLQELDRESVPGAVLSLGDGPLDALVLGAGITVLAAGRGGFVRTDITPGPATVVRQAAIDVTTTGTTLAVRAAPTSGLIALAHTETDDVGVAARLRVAWLPSDGSGPARSPPPIAIAAARDGVLDVLPIEGGALLVYDSAGVVYGHPLCPPPP